MNKEEIANVSQLLVSMRGLSIKLSEAMKNKDMERVLKIKRELLNLQQQVDKLL